MLNFDTIQSVDPNKLMDTMEYMTQDDLTNRDAT